MKEITIKEYAATTGYNRRYIQKLVQNNRLDLLPEVQSVRLLETAGRGMYLLAVKKSF